MSSLWEERAARNEALFREVNEQVRSLSERFNPERHVVDFVCECSDDSCTDRVSVPVAIYEIVRAEPRRFLLKRGHQVVIPAANALRGHRVARWLCRIQAERRSSRSRHGFQSQSGCAVSAAVTPLDQVGAFVFEFGRQPFDLGVAVLKRGQLGVSVFGPAGGGLFVPLRGLLVGLGGGAMSRGRVAVKFHDCE